MSGLLKQLPEAVLTCIALRSALNSALLFFCPSPSSEAALSLLSLLVLLLGGCCFCCNFPGVAFFRGVDSSVLSVEDDRSLLAALAGSLGELDCLE